MRDLSRVKFKSCLGDAQDAIAKASGAMRVRGEALAALRHLVEAMAGLEGAIDATADIIAVDRAEGETLLARQLKASVDRVIDKNGGKR